MTPRNLFLLGLCAVLIGFAWIYQIPDAPSSKALHSAPQASASLDEPGAGSGLPDAVVAVLTQNEPAERNVQSARKDASQPPNAGSLSGVVQMDGAPYEGASIRLIEIEAFVAAEEDEAAKATKEIETAATEEGEAPIMFPVNVGVRTPPTFGGGRRKAALVTPTESDASGRFVFEGLKPGDYRLEARHARANTKVSGAFRIRAGEDLDVGTLSLPPPSAEWKARMAAAKIPPARVRVVTGTPGLRVGKTARGEQAPSVKGTTNEEGNYEFRCNSTRPICIDLLNPAGFLVATTGAYESFASDTETVVQLPPAVGSLALELPSDWTLSSGQAIQCLVMLESAIPRDPIVTTIRTDAALADGLRFPTLFAGEYTIEAIFIDITPEGRWLARSKRAVGRVQVRTGQATRCLLK